MTNVTKTYLPDKDKYKQYVDEIYNNNWLTNNGPLVQRLEKKLAEYLGVKNIVLVSNGTVALEIAYRALELKNYVITTPFSFVATTSSLVTNGLSPIFVDINENTFNIESSEIKNFITRNTSAIVPVHVFGNICNVEEIDSLAKKHNIKVIYDASHAFDIKYKDQSVLSYGDISTISFHATKIFHTIEGGALVINDDKLAEKARYLINFGIKNEEEIPYLGINAKMNEFEAAMGLCLLDEFDYIKSAREKIYHLYEKELAYVVRLQKQHLNSTNNYGYFPIVFESEEQLIRVKKELNKNDIFPRRYFYPSLDSLEYIEPKQNCTISRSLSKRILCLPIFVGLDEEIQYKIITTIKNNI